MNSPSDIEQARLISRREAIRRVTAMLGGAALVGGSDLLAAVEKAASATPATPAAPAAFTATDIAFLDEIAETILPETKTPGAKAAKVGAFMALMVTDCYWPVEQNVFRAGMRSVDDATKKAHKVSFMAATPQQRLAVLTALDHEQKRVMDARDAAQRRRMGLAPLSAHETATKPDAYVPDQRKDSASATAVSATSENGDGPAHFFRMMKELTLLGYFTSEIGCTQAQRYVEVPGRYDPCVPYIAGDPAWASHA